MTPLAPGKKVTRQTAATVFSGGKRREVAVTIRQWTVEFRLKGERRRYELPIEQLYKTAVRVHVAAEKAERRKARNAH